MNIFDMDTKVFEGLASDYYGRMYESQYDDEEQNFVSNCCSIPMNFNSSICLDCKEHCVPVVIESEVKSVTPEEVSLLEDIPF